MPQIIEVPELGLVSFPDGMSDDAISEAIRRQYPKLGTLPPERAARQAALRNELLNQQRVPEATGPSFRRAVADPLLSLAEGVVSLPQSLAGILDIPTGGLVSKVLEADGYGFQPKATKEFISEFYSPQAKAAQQRVREAEGFFPTLEAMVENPSTITAAVLESAPSMLGGAGIARKALAVAPKLSPFVAAAIGEGAITAGQTANQLVEQSPDGYLSPKQSALSLTSGLATGLIGAIGGKLASKLGITDVDVWLASGTVGQQAAKKSMLRRVVESGISEGLFEELPQSAQEQIQSNLAMDKPWSEGVAEAAAAGMVAGAVMGAAGGIPGGGRQLPPRVTRGPQPYMPPGAPPPTAPRIPTTPVAPVVPPRLPAPPQQKRQRVTIPEEPAEENEPILATIRRANAKTIPEVQALWPDAGVTDEMARDLLLRTWGNQLEVVPSDVLKVRQKNAITIRQIQALFPERNLNREQARDLRDAAWGKMAQDPVKEIEQKGTQVKTTPLNQDVKTVEKVNQTADVPKSSTPPETPTPQLAIPTLAENQHYLFDSKAGDVASTPNGGNILVIRHFDKLKDAQALANALTSETKGGLAAQVEAWIKKPAGNQTKGKNQYTVLAKNVSDVVAESVRKAAEEKPQRNLKGDQYADTQQSPVAEVKGDQAENLQTVSEGKPGEVLQPSKPSEAKEETKVDGQPVLKAGNIADLSDSDLDAMLDEASNAATKPVAAQTKSESGIKFGTVTDGAGNPVKVVTTSDTKPERVLRSDKLIEVSKSKRPLEAERGKIIQLLDEMQRRRDTDEGPLPSMESEDKLKARLKIIERRLYEDVTIQRLEKKSLPTTPKPKTKTALDIIKEAAKSGVTGIDESIKGLSDLFGGGTHIGSGLPSFDENTYAKAKPHFEKAYQEFKKAGKSLNEFLQFIFKNMGDRIRPYLKRYVQEKREIDKAAATTETPAISSDQKIVAILESTDNGQVKAARVRALADERGLTVKQMQEAIESEIVKIAHRLALDGTMESRAKFDKMIELYNKQPTMSARTSTSVDDQAYSTPVPLAYAMSHATGVTSETSVYDATGGNGMLLIGSHLAGSQANEINPSRAKSLREFGVKTVTENDATKYTPTGTFPIIHLNPPFGSIDNVNYGGFGIKKLEHIIALQAFEALDDDGVGMMILGARREEGPGGKGAQWVFENYLYGHYNVVSNFEVEGDLYSKQGAKWPVRVIVVAGRRQLPVGGELSPKTVARFSTWDDVWTEAQRIRDEIASRRNSVVPGDAPGLPVPPQPPATPTSQTGTVPPPAIRHPGTPAGGVRPPGEGGSQPATPTRPVGGSSGFPPTRPSDEPTNAELHPAQPDGGRKSGAPVEVGLLGTQPPKPDAATGGAESGAGTGAGRLPGQTPLTPPGLQQTEFQIPYVPRSKGTPFDTLTPTNIGEGEHSALDKLVARVGPIDEFVANHLNMEVGELRDIMAAEQIDGVALAIDQIENGDALIIGDETGIGKGRQAAGVIRYAILNDILPIFFTKDPNLFSNLYGDMLDIHTTVKPFILGDTAKASIVDQEGNVIHRALGSQAKEREMQNILEKGMAEAGYDSIFVTYSQINTRNARQMFLERLAANQRTIVILDEAHDAAGDATSSMRAAFISGGQVRRGSGANITTISVPGLLRQEGTRQGQGGVLYMSATYAKRPENMPVYFRTALSRSAQSFQQVVTAMKRGGVALQQAVSEALAKAGQYLRRERDFTGIKFDMKLIEPADEAKLVEHVDEITDVLSEIVRFSRAIKDAVVGSTAQTENQTSMTDFASVVHNQVGQMLLATKVDHVVAEALAAKARGEKPVLALMNTMESFLDHYTDDNGFENGQTIQLRWNELLKYALERSLRVTEKLPNGDTEISVIDPDTVGLGDYYRQVQGMADGIESKFPISPIDYIIQKLAQSGLKMAELTGRTSGIEYTNFETGEGIYRHFKQANKNSVVNGFNNGDSDGMLLNASGSTGLSAHASVKFKSQLPRHMIVIQPALDIAVFVQTLGRIRRTGQLDLGTYPDGTKYGARYTYLLMPLQAELRPAAMAVKKMKSLNANTTAEAKGAIKISADDIYNKYGDLVVSEYLEGHPELQQLLGLDIQHNQDGSISVEQDVARKFTGRQALLPDADQKNGYAEILPAYQSLIEQLKATGEYNLEIVVHDDWAAVKRSDEELGAGTDPSNILTAGVRLQQWELNDDRHVPTGTEMQQDFTRRLGSRQKLMSDWDAVQTQFDAALEKRVSDLQAKHDGAAPADKPRLEQQLHSLDEMRQRWSATKDSITGLISDAGRAVELANTETGDSFDGLMTDVTFPKTVRVTASAFRFRFMVNDPTGTIYMTAADFAHGKWTKDVSSKEIRDFTGTRTGARSVRYFVTGNPIQSMDATGGRGQMTRFKSADGEIITGLLMPRNWGPANLVNDPRLDLLNGAAVVHFMRNYGQPQYRTYIPVESGGVARIIKTPGSVSSYLISVPAARRTGGPVYLDPALRRITGDFTKTGSRMVATIEERDLQSAADRISEVLKARFRAIGEAGTLTPQVTESNARAGRSGGRPPQQSIGEPVSTPITQAAAEAVVRETLGDLPANITFINDPASIAGEVTYRPGELPQITLNLARHDSVESLRDTLLEELIHPVMDAPENANFRNRMEALVTEAALEAQRAEGYAPGTVLQEAANEITRQLFTKHSESSAFRRGLNQIVLAVKRMFHVELTDEQVALHLVNQALKNQKASADGTAQARNPFKRSDQVDEEVNRPGVVPAQAATILELAGAQRGVFQGSPVADIDALMSPKATPGHPLDRITQVTQRWLAPIKALLDVSPAPRSLASITDAPAKEAAAGMIVGQHDFVAGRNSALALKVGQMRDTIAGLVAQFPKVHVNEMRSTMLKALSDTLLRDGKAYFKNIVATAPAGDNLAAAASELLGRSAAKIGGGVVEHKSVTAVLSQIADNPAIVTANMTPKKLMDEVRKLGGIAIPSQADFDVLVTGSKGLPPLLNQIRNLPGVIDALRGLKADTKTAKTEMDAFEAWFGNNRTVSPYEFARRYSTLIAGAKNADAIARSISAPYERSRNDLIGMLHAQDAIQNLINHPEYRAGVAEAVDLIGARLLLIDEDGGFFYKVTSPTGGKHTVWLTPTKANEQANRSTIANLLQDIDDFANSPNPDPVKLASFRWLEEFIKANWLRADFLVGNANYQQVNLVNRFLGYIRTRQGLVEQDGTRAGRAAANALLAQDALDKRLDAEGLNADTGDFKSHEVLRLGMASHGLDVKSPADVTQYIEQVLNPLIASNQDFGGVHMVTGSVIPRSGEKVTKFDMEVAWLQLGHENRVRKIVGSKMEGYEEPVSIADTLFGQKATRRAIATGPMTTTRGLQRWGMDLAMRWKQHRAAIIANWFTDPVEFGRMIRGYVTESNPQFERKSQYEKEFQQLTAAIANWKTPPFDDWAGLVRAVATIRNETTAMVEGPLRKALEAEMAGHLDNYATYAMKLREKQGSSPEKGDSEITKFLALSLEVDGSFVKARGPMLVWSDFYKYTRPTKSERMAFRANALNAGRARSIDKMKLLLQSMQDLRRTLEADVAALQSRGVFTTSAEKRAYLKKQFDAGDIRYTLAELDWRIPVLAGEIKKSEVAVSHAAQDLLPGARDFLREIGNMIIPNLLTLASTVNYVGGTWWNQMSFDMHTRGAAHAAFTTFAYPFREAAHGTAKIVRALEAIPQFKSITRHKAFSFGLVKMLQDWADDNASMVARFEEMGVKTKYDSRNRFIANVRAGWGLSGRAYTEENTPSGIAWNSIVRPMRFWNDWVTQWTSANWSPRLVDSGANISNANFALNHLAWLASFAKRIADTRRGAVLDPNNPALEIKRQELGLDRKQMHFLREYYAPAGGLEGILFDYWKRLQAAAPNKRSEVPPIDTSTPAGEDRMRALLRSFAMRKNVIGATNSPTTFQTSEEWRMIGTFKSYPAAALSQALKTIPTSIRPDDLGRFLLFALLTVAGGVGVWELTQELKETVTGRSAAQTRLANIVDDPFGVDGLRYGLVAASSILPYGGFIVDRVLGGGSSRSPLDLTAMVPQIQFGVDSTRAISEMLQSGDFTGPALNLINRYSGAVAGVVNALPASEGSLASRNVTRSLRSATPYGIEMRPISGSGFIRPNATGRLLRSAEIAAFTGDTAAAQAAISGAVDLKMRNKPGLTREKALSEVRSALTARTGESRVFGRRLADSERSQIYDRMTDRQRADVAAGDRAQALLKSLVAKPKRARRLTSRRSRVLRAPGGSKGRRLRMPGLNSRRKTRYAALVGA